MGYDFFFVSMGLSLVFLYIDRLYLWGHFLPFFAAKNFSNTLLIILVISCPCGLVISIPLGCFGGISGAAKKGILIKGSTFLDILNHVKTVVSDKTGTLTKGTFHVTQIVTKNGFSQDELLSVAAHIEAQSTHPIAQPIKEAYKGELDLTKVTNYNTSDSFEKREKKLFIV